MYNIILPYSQHGKITLLDFFLNSKSVLSCLFSPTYPLCPETYPSKPSAHSRKTEIPAIMTTGQQKFNCWYNQGLKTGEVW